MFLSGLCQIVTVRHGHELVRCSPNMKKTSRREALARGAYQPHCLAADSLV